jgi:catechol 2,3-dioxygenase-like lactoylglutathione lyase family enzyme
MLRDSRAFSSFSVRDLARANEFYGGKLGLDVGTEPVGEPAGLELRIDGRRPLLIYPKDNHEPATYTVLNFVVDDIEKTVDGLVAAGIPMEHYGIAFGQDQKGIARNPDGPIGVAWFKDPDGNILSIREE